MAASSDPDEVLRSTSGKANFQRVARLLISGGTTLLREIFDLNCPPSKLPTVLKSPATVKQLKAVKLTKPQWDCLYPSPGVYGNSEELDITLLFRLLRTICNLTPPATGWDALPTSTDLTLEANLARIKYYRNSVYGHVNQKMEIANDEFPQLWQEIKDALVGIAEQVSSAKKTEWKKAIDNFLHDPLTAEDERNVEELLRWYENDTEVMNSVDELKRTTQKGFDRLETSLEQKEQNLEMAVQRGVQEVKAHLGEQFTTTTEVVKEGMEHLETSLKDVHGRIEGTTREVERAFLKGVQDINHQLREEVKATTQDAQKSLETAVHEEAQDIKEQLSSTTKDVHEGMERLETRLKGVEGGIEGATHVLEAAVRVEIQGIKDKLEEVHQSIEKLHSQAEGSQSPGGKTKRVFASRLI